MEGPSAVSIALSIRQLVQSGQSRSPVLFCVAQALALLMRQCWRADAKERPTSKGIHETLHEVLVRRRVTHAMEAQGTQHPPALRHALAPHVVVVPANPRDGELVQKVKGLHSYDRLQDKMSEGVLHVEEVEEGGLRINKFNAVRAKAIAWFNEIDTDGSGTLDRDELLQLARNNSEYLTRAGGAGH